MRPFSLVLFACVLALLQCQQGHKPTLRGQVINTAVTNYALNPTGEKLYYLRQYNPLDTMGLPDMLVFNIELYEYDCHTDSSLQLARYHTIKGASAGEFDSLLAHYRTEVSTQLTRFEQSELAKVENGWILDAPLQHLLIKHRLTNCLADPLSVTKRQICTKEYQISFEDATITLSSRDAQYLGLPSSKRWVSSNKRLIINYAGRLWSYVP